MFLFKNTARKIYKIFAAKVLLMLPLCVLVMASHNTCADMPEFTLEIKNHLFYPATLNVPANTRFKLLVKNLDDTPEEFESNVLNREKLIVGKGTGIIFLGPLKPGSYSYFGEFNPKTAQGNIVAEETKNSSNE